MRERDLKVRAATPTFNKSDSAKKGRRADIGLDGAGGSDSDDDEQSGSPRKRKDGPRDIFRNADGGPLFMPPRERAMRHMWGRDTYQTKCARPGGEDWFTLRAVGDHQGQSACKRALSVARATEAIRSLEGPCDEVLKNLKFYSREWPGEVFLKFSDELEKFLVKKLRSRGSPRRCRKGPEWPHFGVRPPGVLHDELDEGEGEGRPQRSQDRRGAAGSKEDQVDGEDGGAGRWHRGKIPAQVGRTQRMG